MSHFLTSTFLVCFLTIFVAPWHSIASGEEPSNRESVQVKIRELQKKRVDVLQRAVDFCLVGYREGAVGFMAVSSAQRELMEAKLEMAKTRQERTALLTSHLKITEQSLAIAEARHQAAQATLFDVQRAKSSVLQIKIRLLKLQVASESKKRQ